MKFQNIIPQQHQVILKLIIKLFVTSQVNINIQINLRLQKLSEKYHPPPLKMSELFTPQERIKQGLK